MPTNNFKLFDENKANIMSDTEYAGYSQRLNGVQSGIASSTLNNKFAYQVSLVSYAIAQIMNQNGLDASDTLAVSAFVGNLSGSLMQKVADRASSSEAAAGVLSNKYISPATMKAAALLLSGGTLKGDLNMGGNKITNLPTPSASSEAATKGYVDGKTTKVETVEELTFVVGQDDENIPNILDGKDFSNAIAVRQTVIMNGSIDNGGYSFGLYVAASERSSAGSYYTFPIIVDTQYNNEKKVILSFLTQGRNFENVYYYSAGYGETYTGVRVNINKNYITESQPFIKNIGSDSTTFLTINYKLEVVKLVI